MLFKSCSCCQTGAWTTFFVCYRVCCSLLSNLVEVAVDCAWILFVKCWPQSDASAIRFLFVISWSWIHHCSNFSLNSQPLNSPWISNLWIHYPCHESKSLAWDIWGAERFQLLIVNRHGPIKSIATASHGIYLEIRSGRCLYPRPSRLIRWYGLQYIFSTLSFNPTW